MLKLNLLKKLLLTTALITTATVSAKDHCKDTLAEMEKCFPPFAFTYAYELVCTSGDELSPADLNNIYKSFEQELAADPCLAKAFRPPKVKRKSRAEFRKQQAKEEREARELRRRERKEQREQKAREEEERKKEQAAQK